MKLVIEMAMDNEAFEPSWADETARILRNLADYIEGYPGDFRFHEGYGLSDVNGNRVGRAILSED
jgi:hypothetical protein